MGAIKVTNGVTVTNREGKEGKIESIDITELGYIRIKVYYQDEGRWINYVDASGLKSLIGGCNLKLKEEAAI